MHTKLSNFENNNLHIDSILTFKSYNIGNRNQEVFTHLKTKMEEVYFLICHACYLFSTRKHFSKCSSLYGIMAVNKREFTHILLN